MLSKHTKKQTAREVLYQAVGIPWDERETLLAHVLKISRVSIITHPERKVDQRNSRTFFALAKRRRADEPLAYLLGTQPFCGLEFIVNKSVLIPRPETEWLVEKAIETLHKHPEIKTVIDVGTGSGCIVISVLHKLSEARKRNIVVYATDVSLHALKVARINAKLHGIKNIQWRSGNLLKPFISQLKKEDANSSAVLLLANLPYVPTDDYKQSAIAVRKYEPRAAIHAGVDGLKFYRPLARTLKQFPSIKWHCLWEIDPCHAKSINTLVHQFLDGNISIHRDFSHKFRYLIAT